MLLQQVKRASIGALVKTPTVRTPSLMTSLSRESLPSAACLDICVKSTVMSEIDTRECGTRKIPSA